MAYVEILVCHAHRGKTPQWIFEGVTFNSKLSRWKAKYLTFAGRVILAKAVLGSLANYFFSCFLAPKKIIQKLEAIRRDFVWGKKGSKNKMRWIKWDKMVKPKNFGGAGVGDIQSMNLALLAKWWWKYKEEPTSLWAEVIKAIHTRKKKVQSIPINIKYTGLWKDILGIEKEFCKSNISIKCNLKAVVGDGGKTLFWIDHWLGNEPIMDRYPNLFGKAKHKYVTVDMCVTKLQAENRWAWDWISDPTSDHDWVQLRNLMDELKEYTFKSGKDAWIWKGREAEVLSVSVIRNELMKASLTNEDVEWAYWNKWVVPKVNYFCWRASLDKIPSKMELMKRGVPGINPICNLCGIKEETSKHIMVECLFAKSVWWQVFVWLKVPVPQSYGSIQEVLSYVDSQNGSKVWKKTINTIMLATMWQIWKTRNEKEFNGNFIPISKTVDEIKSNTFLWINTRSKLKETVWERWRDFNIRDVIT